RFIGFRFRVETNGHFGDDAERAPRSSEQAGEIESGDVLHDTPAAASDDAGAGHELQAEHEIARTSERRDERTRGSPSHRSSPPPRRGRRGARAGATGRAAPPQRGSRRASSPPAP